jgi:hypothetical protein
MTSLEKGRFCDSCKKQVFDFTQFSNIELARKIKRGDNLCGRLEKKQVNTDIVLLETSLFNKFKYVFSFAALFITAPSLFSQEFIKKEKTIQTDNKVIANLSKSQDYLTIKIKEFDNQGSLPGVSIHKVGTKKNYESNFNGEFEIKVKRVELNKSFKITL